MSNDVSLTQPYDGGAWPIPPASSWIIQKTGAVGVALTTVMLDVPVDSVYRLFAASVFTFAGTQPLASIQIRDMNAVPIVAVTLSARLQVLAPGQGSASWEIFRNIVIPGGLRLDVDQFLGAADSQIRISVYGCLAPAGSVFSC